MGQVTCSYNGRYGSFKKLNAASGFVCRRLQERIPRNGYNRLKIINVTLLPIYISCGGKAFCNSRAVEYVVCQRKSKSFILLLNVNIEKSFIS